MQVYQNLFKYEKHVRNVGGFVLVLAAIYFNVWWLAFLGVFSFVTSSYNYCPMYGMVGVNKDVAKQRYYLSQFPIYNPEPILLGKKNGKLTFKNAAAVEVFEGVDSLDELFPKDSSIAKVIEESGSVFNQLVFGKRTYMVHFKGIPEIDSVLVFALNITDIVEINKEIVDTQKDIVYKMGEIGETRSKETGQHVKRVAEYSYILARAAGLSETEADTLRIASPMHDIGKVGIPDSVLKKPGKLDAEEWVTMKTHTQIGYEMLRNSKRPILKTAAIVAYEHHEKWDGKGYPNGLKEDNIHIYGRITAIADVFDALGSKRVYKDAWELDKILDLFKEESGKQFDPSLVDLMFANLDKFLEIRDSYKDAE